VAAREHDHREHHPDEAGWEDKLYRLLNPGPGVDPDAMDKAWTGLENGYRDAVADLEKDSTNPADIAWLITYVCAAVVRHPGFGEAVNRWRADRGRHGSACLSPGPPVCNRGTTIQIASKSSGLWTVQFGLLAGRRAGGPAPPARCSESVPERPWEPEADRETDWRRQRQLDVTRPRKPPETELKGDEHGQLEKVGGVGVAAERAREPVVP